MTFNIFDFIGIYEFAGGFIEIRQMGLFSFFISSQKTKKNRKLFKNLKKTEKSHKNKKKLKKN